LNVYRKLYDAQLEFFTELNKKLYEMYKDLIIVDEQDSNNKKLDKYKEKIKLKSYVINSVVSKLDKILSLIFNKSYFKRINNKVVNISEDFDTIDEIYQSKINFIYCVENVNKMITSHTGCEYVIDENKDDIFIFSLILNVDFIRLTANNLFLLLNNLVKKYKKILMYTPLFEKIVEYVKKDVCEIKNINEFIDKVESRKIYKYPFDLKGINKVFVSMYPKFILKYEGENEKARPFNFKSFIQRTKYSQYINSIYIYPEQKMFPTYKSMSRFINDIFKMCYLFDINKFKINIYNKENNYGYGKMLNIKFDYNLLYDYKLFYDTIYELITSVNFSVIENEMYIDINNKGNEFLVKYKGREYKFKNAKEINDMILNVYVLDDII